MASFQVVTTGGTTQPDGSFSVAGVFWLAAPSNAVVPAPAAVSVVPGVLASDLAALRAGAIVEQAFTTGLYASGTTQAAVDADLLARFTAAQNVLNAGNPALATAVLRAYNGSSWGPLGQTAPPGVLSPTSAPIHLELPWAAAFSLVPNMVAGRSTGYVNTSATSPAKIRATVYTPQGTNAQRSVSSSSASDAAAGTGAQSVTINYLDAGFVAHSETVTLNGTTAVNTVGTNIAYIESMVVATVGSGTTNAGTITIFTATAGGGSAWGSIAATDGMSFWAHHYVPAGVTCYPLSLSGGGTVVGGRMNLIRTGNPSATNLPVRQVGGTYTHLAAGGLVDHQFTIPIPIQGPDLIYVTDTPFAVTASVAVGTFEYVQF